MSRLQDDLHTVFTEAVNHVRTRLGAADIGQFDFTINAGGRTETGVSDVKIEYRVSPSCWSSEAVTGGSLDAVLDEVIRRHQWRQRNAPLALAPPADAA